MSASRNTQDLQEEVDLCDLNATSLYSTTCLSSIYLLLPKSSTASSNGFFSGCCPAVSRFVANMLSSDSDDEDENEQVEALSSIKVTR
jgi:hypothetical protein